MSAQMLPDELWSQIISEVGTPDRSVLLPLLCVSKPFFKTAVPLFYHSIHIVHRDSDKKELIKTFPCTPIDVNSLHLLPHALRMHQSPLSAHTQSFGWTSFASSELTRTMLGILSGIFPNLLNLKRLSVVTGPYTRTINLLRTLPQSVQLTHIEIKSDLYVWSTEDIQALLERSHKHSLQVISMPPREIYVMAPLTVRSPFPNVRELRASPSSFSGFLPSIPPSQLQDFSIDLSPFAEPQRAEPSNAGAASRTAVLSSKYWIFENLRSVEIVFDLIQAQLSFKKVLKCLRCVEYVRISAPVDFSGEIKIDDLLTIAPQTLKYIFISSKLSSVRYSLTSLVLFDTFPSLILVDFASHSNSLEQTDHSAARITRGNPHKFEMVRFKTPPPFKQWWEELEMGSNDLCS